MEQRASRRCRTLAAGWLCALGLLVPAIVSAQQTGSVRGRVVEEASQRPLPGVQVSVVGTGRGGLTQANGEYLILNVPAGAQTVRAEIIGYRGTEQSVTVSAGGTATSDFALAPQAIDLTEIVVTGTPGAVSRRSLGNSITKIDTEQLAERSTLSNVAELLTARAPGVQLLANSGTPGTAVDIRVRGAGSFIGNQPVVFVDGVRVSTDDLGSFAPSGAGTTSFSAQATSAFDLINPQDIESIEIIKGPAAATLYGAEAAGGVIQIITKRGSLGSRPLRFDVRMEQGVNDWELDIPTNYTVCTQARLNERDGAGDPVWPGCQGLSAGSLITDNPMQRDPLALRTGDVQRITVSGRGGGENISYYVAASRDREQGVFHNSFNNRTALRANFSATPNDRIDFNVSTAYVRGDLRLPLGDESAQGLLLSASRGMPGRVPPAGDPDRAGWFTVNPAMANAYDNTTKSDRFTIGSTINARPFDWFRNRLTVGLDYTTSLARIVSPPGSVDAEFAGAVEGTIGQRQPRAFQTTVDYVGNVEFDVSPDFRSTTSVGLQASARRTETLLATGRGFGSPDVMLIGTAQVTSGSNTIIESRNLGYFIQEQVAWKDRLFLTGAVRADDHSAFGTNFDIIFYPKAQLSWVLSEEPAFGSALESLRVSNLRLRGAWGQAGRAPDPFTATQAYTIDRMAAGEEVRSAVRAFRFGNPDLTAERGEELELGFDAGLFDDRLGAELTYYRKRMRDVIVSSGVAGSSGFGGTFYGSTIAQLLNLGETLNSGIELSLNATPVLTRNVSWQARLNLATNSNELISFGDDRVQLTPASQAYGVVQQHRVGHPLAGYWAALPLRDANGDPVLNASGAVQLDTATFIGPSAPTREISFSNTVTLFNNLQLYALLDYKGGHYLFNYKEYDRCRFRANCERLTDPSNVDRVTGEVLNPEVRVWTQTIPGAWIEEADFVKLRDLSLTYSLPAAWAQQFRATRASITVAGHNLAMWTDYSGIDPETNSYGNRSFVRADIYAAPMIRRLSFAINLGF